MLAETLHFGRAAERLHVSQPALSKRIRRMEGRIGGPLLVRGYRDVQLTEAGRLLAGRSRHLIGEVSATSRLPSGQREAKPGSSASASASPAFSDCCRTWCCAFAARIPDVQFHLRDMSTPDQIDALVRGEIDVGFIRHRDADDRLHMRHVLDERLVAAVGPRSQWNSRAGLRSVASEPFIIIARSRSASFYDHVLSVCAAAGFAPQHRAGGGRAVHGRSRWSVLV